MDMSGEYRIAAPRERVWAALNDPEVLRQCIPGCESLEKLSDTQLKATARLKIGPVSARFSGEVTLSDLDPPNGYTITGSGSGGAAGFGKGGARVTLAEDGPDATRLSYTAEAQVGGKLAQIGSRLVQGTAKKLADDFFAQFSEVVAPTVEEPDTDAAATELLVEVAEEIEANPSVPAPGLENFASVPLQAHPQAVVQLTEETAAAMARLAEPHHRVDEDATAAIPEDRTGAVHAASMARPLPEPVAAAPSGVAATAPGAVPAGEERKGLSPVVWIPLVMVGLGVIIALSL